MNVGGIDQAMKRAFEAKAQLEKAQEMFNQAEDERVRAAGELRGALQDLKPVFVEAMKLAESILGPGPMEDHGRKPWPTPKFDSSAFEADPL